MDFSRPWTIFAVDAEYDAYGAARLVTAHNDLLAQLQEALRQLAHHD
jgi:hypothetical protein